MKKIIFAIIACFALCSCHTQFGIAYGVKLTGNGDGQFEVSFPEGSYAMDGTASIALQVGDSIPFGKVTTKAEVLENGNTKEIAVLKAVNDSVATQFDATAASGTYELWLKGFVKETGTGLIFEIDRHWTNREALKKMRALSNDPYPYIK